MLAPTPPQPGVIRRHIPQLDGLSAVAVLGVLAYQTGVLPGGYLGIDCLFVLSGFLATSLLLEEQDATGRIHLRAFWVRRGYRLLPGAVTYLVVATALALPLGRASRQEMASTWAGHLWPVWVQGQFYLVWPILLVALLAAARLRRHVPTVVGCLLAAVVLWRALLLAAGAEADRVHFGADTRADALLVGCALALLWRGGALDRVPERAWTFLPRTAWIVLAVAATTSPRMEQSEPTWLTWGGFTVVALAVAAVIAGLLMAPRATTSRLLALPPLVRLGGISYAVYLWHHPIAGQVSSWFAPDGAGPVVAFLLTLMASALVAEASRRWVEDPIGGRCPVWARDGGSSGRHAHTLQSWHPALQVAPARSGHAHPEEVADLTGLTEFTGLTGLTGAAAGTGPEPVPTRA